MMAGPLASGALGGVDEDGGDWCGPEVRAPTLLEDSVSCQKVSAVLRSFFFFTRG